MQYLLIFQHGNMQLLKVAAVKYVIKCELFDSIFSSHLICYILLFYVLQLNLDSKHFSIKVPLSHYLTCFMSIARKILCWYCRFLTAVLQYQYQSFSIVLQYKTARLVHPWFLSVPPMLIFIPEFDYLSSREEVDDSGEYFLAESMPCQVIALVPNLQESLHL